jgi:hypothetical protein
MCIYSASFRFRLATDTLASPCGSAHHGPRGTFTSSYATCLAHNEAIGNLMAADRKHIASEHQRCGGATSRITAPRPSLSTRIAKRSIACRSASAERRFIQALIQAAVAVYQLTRENLTGATRLFHSGRRYMEPYRSTYLRLDVAHFWQQMEAHLAPALTGGVSGPRPVIVLVPRPTGPS